MRSVHFVSVRRIGGGRFGRIRVSCFAGRPRDLTAVGRWSAVAGHGGVAERIVAGAAGVAGLVATQRRKRSIAR